MSLSNSPILPSDSVFSHASLASHSLTNPMTNVLDELHTEQKNTIDALSYQVQFFRQRDERWRKENQVLNRYLSEIEHGDDDVRKLAAELANMSEEKKNLGDEVDALKLTAKKWEEDEKQLRNQLINCQSQLRVATSNLSEFKKSMEQLELKVQRKEAQVQTQWMALEQDVKAQRAEIEKWQQEASNAQNLSDKLRFERDNLAQKVHQLQNAEQNERNSELERLRREIEDLRKNVSSSELSIRALRSENSALQSDLDSKKSDLKAIEIDSDKLHAELDHMRRELSCANENLAMHEQLTASNDARIKDSDAMRNEVMSKIASAENERNEWIQRHSALQSEMTLIQSELKSAKLRLSSRDNSVITATLKSELNALKNSMQREIKLEKASLLQEKSRLESDLFNLRTLIQEREQSNSKLQKELNDRDMLIQSLKLESMQFQSKAQRLQEEMDHLLAQFQQFQDCRSSLAEQMNSGFKNLIQDEQDMDELKSQLAILEQQKLDWSAREASLHAQLQILNREKEQADSQHKSSVQILESRLKDLRHQLEDRENEVIELRHVSRKINVLEKEKLCLKEETEAYENERLRYEQLENQRISQLQNQLNAMESEKKALFDEILDLKNLISQQTKRINDSEYQLKEREIACASAQNQIESGEQQISQLQACLQKAFAERDAVLIEKSAGEKKLLKERREMKKQIQDLFTRMEQVGKRNEQLGQKITDLLKQSKSYQGDIIAHNATIENFRKKWKDCEAQVIQLQNERSESLRNTKELERQISELSRLKDTYQLQLNQEKNRNLHPPTMEKEILQHERDQALERVHSLLERQEKIKLTVEAHISQLVEEIETLQHSLEEERRRCLILQSNEKKLLENLDKKMKTVEKLESAHQLLQKKLQAEDINEPPHSHNFQSRNPSPASSGLDLILRDLAQISEFSEPARTISPCSYRS